MAKRTDVHRFSILMACIGKSESGGWYARHETNHTILRKDEHPQGGFDSKEEAAELAAEIAQDNGFDVTASEIEVCESRENPSTGTLWTAMGALAGAVGLSAWLRS